MTPLERIRLEKAAADCGFDRTTLLNEKGELELRSAQFPEVIYLRSEGGSGFRVTASVPALLDSLNGEAIQVDGIERLYAVLQHASAVARTLPNRVADQFRCETLDLPRTTEAERLVVQRVGQDLFRQALLDYWHGRCCVTGLAVPALLRASHIKPWAQCETDDERLDVFNGLLLAPQLDALFDGGWITFSDAGGIKVSQALPVKAWAPLGLSRDLCLHGLTAYHAPFLSFHQEQVFIKSKW